MPIGYVEKEVPKADMGVPLAILGCLGWWFWRLWPLTSEILHEKEGGQSQIAE